MRENDFAKRLAEEYRIMSHAYPNHDEFQNTVAQAVAKHFKDVDQSQIKLLEIGGGTGTTSAFLLKADPRIRLTAVDSSARMLEQAETNLAHYKERVTFVVSDALDFVRSQPDASFDAFAAVWTLHNFQPDYRQKVFEEIHRILKPNGIFVSGDKYAVADPAEHKQQLETQLQKFRELSTIGSQDIVDGWVQHNIEDEAIKITEQDQKDILEKLGFSDIEVIYRKNMEAVIKAVK